MEFTLQMFWEPEPGKIEPFLLPLTLKFSSAQAARDAFGKVASHPKIPVHSLTLISADGLVSERWFKIDGEWRQKQEG